MNARASSVVLIALLISVFAQPTFAKPKPKSPESVGPGATVLCYHMVEAQGDSRLGVTRETFRQHMRYLANTGYNVIPLRHLYEYVTGTRKSLPKNAVVITIDDGWRSAYTEAFPELKKWRFPFTLFVYPKIVGQTASALSWKQIKQMSDAGVDIQSHTLSHPFLTQRKHSSLGDAQYNEWIQRELVESKKILEKETGKPVTFLAYPYGDYDLKVAKLTAEAGYAAALTCDFGAVRRGSDLHRMKRVVIDRKMSFASFRHYLGARSMRVDEITPTPGSVIDETQPPVITAKIADFKSIDPKSIGIALLGLGNLPYSYDSNDGSLSAQIGEALKGKFHRALVWATDTKTGRRVEYTWTFKLPDPPAAVTAGENCEPPNGETPQIAPTQQSAVPVASGGGAAPTKVAARDAAAAHGVPATNKPRK